MRATSLATLENYLIEQIAANRMRPFNTEVAVQTLASAVMMAVIVDRPADPEVYITELIQLLFGPHVLR